MEEELLKPIVLQCVVPFKATGEAERWMCVACFTKVCCPVSGTLHLLTAYCAISLATSFL